MGNRALSSALQVLAAERRNVKEPLFHQVVLAAPDLGAETFELLAREIGPLAHRYTVYASANDNALMVSGFLHGGLRAGSTMLKSLILPGIDTVDASAVRTDFLGHSYFGDNHSIVDDIRGLVRDDAAPAARKLNPRVLDLLKYWVIPPPPKSPSTPWNINIQGVDLH
jgi:esterase/lipase superfamily enzyme